MTYPISSALQPVSSYTNVSPAGNIPRVNERGPAGSTFQDTVSLTQRYEAKSSCPDTCSIREIAEESYDRLRNKVADVLQQQGIDTRLKQGDQTIDLYQITPEKAQELIADDGYFGVEQTSDRIVDFAIEIAGGDIGRLDAIKTGVEKGFNEAKAAFGDWLPDISYETYDSVMEKLDAWAAEKEV